MSYGSAIQQRIYYSSPYIVKNLIASLYGWIQRRERFGRHFRRHLAVLSESQWFSNQELQQYQFVQTKAFLVYAEKHSKYYHELFQRHGFKPEKMQSLSELQSLPILDKSTVRNNMDEILPDNLPSFNPNWSHTSGTTGQGLHFALSSKCFQEDWSYRMLNFFWAGIRQGMRWAFCAGHPVTYYNRRKAPFWVHDYINNWLLMSSYHLTESNLPDYIAKLKEFEPAMLWGYPSSIYLLALANQQLGCPVHPKVVFTSSETLFDYQRSVIEGAFGCKAFNYYGNGECCAHIAECEKGSLHLKLEYSCVEFLDNRNNPVEAGSEGRIVGTAFRNYAMPLVRYDIGDVVIVSKNKTCACGRSGILVDRVVGRAEDYIVTPDGRFIGRLDHLFKDAVNVRMAQIVQKDVEEVVIRIVKEPGYTGKEEQLILNETRIRLGTQIDVHFEYIDDIPRAKNGKFRFIISEISDKKMFAQATPAVEEY
jgi:phenylacetate-CoA ligase